MADAIYTTPDLDLEDAHVIGDVRAMRDALTSQLRAPRRWNGGLRRTTQARAIQGSNSIEGYSVSDQDALAAVDDEEPLTADERTWAEIRGYRRVLTYILHMAGDEGFRLDAHTLRSMHFMLLEHDLSKSPGQFRAGDIYVQGEDGRTVYQGPDADHVPALIDALSDSISSSRDRDIEPMVRAAMAHLNLVMIHPYRDGNGRMARALQTLVMAQDAVLEPTFSSVEEWLGRNTEDYYRVLAATGAGAWHPERDAHLWVKFNIRAHHMQAQTLTRRFAEAERLGIQIDSLVAQHRLPERVFDPLFDAALGLRVRRPTYVKRSGIEDRTASRDLKALVNARLLTPEGNTRGRFYVASGELIALRDDSRSRRQRLDDPYPWLMDRIRTEARLHL